MRKSALAAWTVLPLVILLAASPCVGQETGSSAPKDRGKLEVHYLNVYQGDATVIFTPGGKTVLIDGGKGGTRWSKYDAGERVVLPFLRDKGVKRIDTIIATHPDFDHIGGLVTVLESDLEIGEFLDPGKTHTSATYKKLMQLVRNRPGLRYRNPRTGDRLDWGPGVTARVVSTSRTRDNNNECSICVQLTHGGVSFLFTGDAEEEAERAMGSRYGRGLRSHVYKVGHHGSRTSSRDFFLRSVRPVIAIISCGGRNKFGHPHEETLDRLASAKAKVFRTDEHGTVRVTSDGKQFSVLKDAWQRP